MKKWLLALVLTGFASLAQAQLNPITWSFSAKKIADKTYELQIDCNDPDQLASVFPGTAGGCGGDAYHI